MWKCVDYRRSRHGACLSAPSTTRLYARLPEYNDRLRQVSSSLISSRSDFLTVRNSQFPSFTAQFFSFLIFRFSVLLNSEFSNLKFQFLVLLNSEFSVLHSSFLNSRFSILNSQFSRLNSQFFSFLISQFSVLLIPHSVIPSSSNFSFRISHCLSISHFFFFPISFVQTIQRCDI